MKWAFALLLCTASLAAAQPAKTAATAAYKEGQQRYAAGEYRAAAAKFTEAYAADPDPVYLFNIAQAYRFARDCREAARYYRQFLTVVEHPPNADRIRRYLDEMDGCVRRESTVAPPAPAPAPPDPTPAPPPASEPAAPAPEPTDTGATRRYVGLAVGGVGLAAIGAGIYFHHRVGVFEDKTNACSTSALCTAEQVHDWQRMGNAASTRAIIGYSIGGAALVTGVTLYVLGRHHPQSVAIAPTRSGAMLAFRF